ncbi:MAG: PD-(D/E)XK nuclease family protein [Colwellia sp.]|nr:PD-(D/E)XK nuclease family protein [Colwellia sp.]
MKFVLVTDPLSASVVRKRLASTGAVDIKVGTFTSLIDSLSELWLVPDIEDDFEQILSDRVLETSNAFWSESIKVDRVGSLSSVESSLRLILASLPLNKTLELLKDDSTRVARYYNDLVKLFDSMKHCRPRIQLIAESWLKIADLQSIESVELICAPELLALELWQTEIIEKVLSLNIAKSDSFSINSVLTEIYQPNPHMNQDVSCLNQNLFNVSDLHSTYDPSNIHWLTCRDSLQETEVVVGMLKKALDSGVDPSEIAVIVPRISEIESTLPALMNYVGILSSNKHAVKSAYQWELQLIKDCLIYFQEHRECGDAYSPMSLAAILTNPLMPWSKYTSQKYSDICFKGAFRKPLAELVLPEADCAILEILCYDSVSTWDTWLEKILEHLKFPNDARCASKKRCVDSIDDLKLYQTQINQIDLNQQLALLINQIQPKHFPFENENTGELQNGILILDESEVLLSPVKHLFILGFNQGCYEVTPNRKGIFTKSNWQHLSMLTDLQFDRTSVKQNHLQALFKNNLSKASHSITLFLSEQGFDGSTIHPSATLLDMALCFQPVEKVKPEVLLKSVKSSDIQLPFLTFEKAIPSTKHQPVIELSDIELGLDLIEINQDKEGNQRTESPSSLNDMLVSPLAWFLSRQGLTGKGWDIQELSVSLQGTIAHKVFELQFDAKNKFSLDDYSILFKEAVAIEAPFLLTSFWRIERLQLKNEIQKSLIPFVEWCQDQKWNIKETELEMLGSLWGLPLRGFADSIFENNTAILILDYKKSKSDKRLKMLNEGFDLQTCIYRELYQQMTRTNVINIQSGYYTLNDCKLLVDGIGGSNSAGIEQIRPNVSLEDQSENAIEQVKSRIEELRKGKITLNSSDDQKIWNDLGIAAEYIFERHPLVKHFMKSEGEQ